MSIIKNIFGQSGNKAPEKPVYVPFITTDVKGFDLRLERIEAPLFDKENAFDYHYVFTAVSNGQNPEYPASLEPIIAKFSGYEAGNEFGMPGNPDSECNTAFISEAHWIKFKLFESGKTPNRTIMIQGDYKEINDGRESSLGCSVLPKRIDPLSDIKQREQDRQSRKPTYIHDNYRFGGGGGIM